MLDASLMRLRAPSRTFPIITCPGGFLDIHLDFDRGQDAELEVRRGSFEKQCQFIDYTHDLNRIGGWIKERYIITP